MNFTFSNTASTSYTIEDTCKLIAQYILILKEKSVTVLPPQTQRQLELFEKAATYAIPAYEGGYKRKKI